MNIKAVDAFNCIIGIAGNIVAHDNSISAEDATTKALEVLVLSEKTVMAWEDTHNEDGSIRPIGDIFSSMMSRSLTPEQRDKVISLKERMGI
ncbi:hypothetical protein LQZ19_08540 [Treponema primitia]|uniref:hypothetical protein n=1 Tax=Treponema primitia TaxID=88058 RepID=UPI00397F57DF